MKTKWYEKIIGTESNPIEIKFKNKRVEVFELFHKNRYKPDKSKEKNNFDKQNYTTLT